jgi:hypothetical protein
MHPSEAAFKVFPRQSALWRSQPPSVDRRNRRFRQSGYGQRSSQLRVAPLHLLENRDRAKVRAAVNIGTTSASKNATSGSRRRRPRPFSREEGSWGSRSAR